MSIDKAGNGEYPVSVNYIVRKGDNLTTISKATGIPISTLAKDNNIKDVNKINIGQLLTLNYHPEKWEAINSYEMNEMYPNHADQVAFFEEMDLATEDRYNRVAKDGAQKHINTEW